MNNEEKPAVQPDYNFILNQQAPPVKRPADKKVFVMFGGVAIVAVLIVVGLVSTVGRRVGSPKDTAATTAAKQVASQYFSNVASNQYDKAFDLFTSPIRDQVNFTDYKLLMPIAFNNIETTQCKLDGNVSQSGNRLVVNYLCPTKNKQFTAGLSFTIVSENQTYKIEYYDIRAKDVNATS